MKPFFLPEFRGDHASSGTMLGAFAILIVTASGPVYAAEDGSRASMGRKPMRVFSWALAEVDNRLIRCGWFCKPGAIPGSVTRYGDAGFVRWRADWEEIRLR